MDSPEYRNRKLEEAQKVLREREVERLIAESWNKKGVMLFFRAAWIICFGWLLLFFATSQEQWLIWVGVGTVVVFGLMHLGALGQEAQKREGL